MIFCPQISVVCSGKKEERNGVQCWRVRLEVGKRGSIEEEGARERRRGRHCWGRCGILRKGHVGEGMAVANLLVNFFNFFSNFIEGD